ncbi:hypothetical protein ITJ66_05875 [Plantibacter sp. VKM Ac-2885]|uniref:hypothetical protein n=1 Tax=Plantibacter sp. VKM Ac-2885 TaxID=2783828 RepID=UPI001889E357|nr:hypothetical protein [Plantibacter sp. VKM Ac-2885]MBF4512013.1 hypothetical protein [Plantibacter sp. VKM Ac-2885]
MTQSRLELIHAGIQKSQTATATAVRLKGHSDPAIRELAQALHHLAFGVQEIALALSDENRGDDLPIQER